VAYWACFWINLWVVPMKQWVTFQKLHTGFINEFDQIISNGSVGEITVWPLKIDERSIGNPSLREFSFKPGNTSINVIGFDMIVHRRVIPENKRDFVVNWRDNVIIINARFQRQTFPYAQLIKLNPNGFGPVHSSSLDHPSLHVENPCRNLLLQLPAHASVSIQFAATQSCSNRWRYFRVLLNLRFLRVRSVAKSAKNRRASSRRTFWWVDRRNRSRNSWVLTFVVNNYERQVLWQENLGYQNPKSACKFTRNFNFCWKLHNFFCDVWSVIYMCIRNTCVLEVFTKVLEVVENRHYFHSDFRLHVFLVMLGLAYDK